MEFIEVVRLRPGDQIKVLPTLPDKLRSLGFIEARVNYAKTLINRIFEAFAVWEDPETGQVFITIENCTEIPFQCAQKVG